MDKKQKKVVFTLKESDDNVVQSTTFFSSAFPSAYETEKYIKQLTENEIIHIVDDGENVWRVLDQLLRRKKDSGLYFLYNTIIIQALEEDTLQYMELIKSKSTETDVMKLQPYLRLISDDVVRTE